jgi:hypothetical protein
MTPLPARHFHTIETVAETLAVDPRRVRGWIRAGELAAVDLGPRRAGGHHRWRISPEALEVFLTARSARPEVKVPRTRRQLDPQIIEFF